MLAQDLAGHPLLDGFTDVQVERLASRLEEVEVEPGTVLTRTGEIALLFYLVIEGSASVTKDGVRLFTLGPGDFFGEMGLLEGDVRTADVIALTPMRVAAMLPGDFEAALEEQPELRVVVRATAEMRRARQSGD